MAAMDEPGDETAETGEAAEPARPRAFTAVRRAFPALRRALVAERGSRAALMAQIAGGLLLFVAVLGVSSRLIATTWLPAVVLATFAPYLMAAAPLAGLVLLAGRAEWIALAALVVTGVAISLELPLYVASGGSSAGPGLTMLTANVRLGNADAAALVATVRKHHVDVLTVQELTPDEVARLQAAGLDELLPAHELDARVGAEGVGLWSRYDLVGGAKHSGFTFALVSARLVMRPGSDDGPTVFAAHIIAPIQSGPGRWAGELNRLHGILRTQPAGAVLVGGDFNSTNDHAQFRRLLTGGYHDAADQSGAGTTRSYPADRWYPPLIGIDHVLTRGARATRARTVSIRGSDHRGLLVNIVLS